MSIIPFIVGGAAIGGVIALARKGASQPRPDNHGKPGDAGPTAGAAGNANASSTDGAPVGNPVAGGLPAAGSNGYDTIISVTSDDGQTPSTGIMDPRGFVTFGTSGGGPVIAGSGSDSTSDPTGGAQPGQVIRTDPPPHVSTAGTKPAVSVIHATGGPTLGRGSGLTKMDVTRNYAQNAGRTGTYI